MSNFYFGWYNGTPTSNGNITIAYWNHIVNEYPVIGNSQNDIIRYSKENYVLALRKFMDYHNKESVNRKFIIDLPISEVYHDGIITASDGYDENVILWKELDWIEYIVRELETDDRIVGWYHADEPEVWGYREVVNGNVVNNNPTIPYTFLKDRYERIKSISSKLVFSVFCDTKLFCERFYEDIKTKGAFYDVFMFDYYPFTLDDRLPTWHKMGDFVKIHNELHPNKMIMYVGQGSGTPVFNTRVPTMEEHQRMFNEFCRYVPNEKRFGYLLWAHSWADNIAQYRGNLILTENLLTQWRTEAYQPIPIKEKPIHILTKIKRFITRLFK